LPRTGPDFALKTLSPGHEIPVIKYILQVDIHTLAQSGVSPWRIFPLAGCSMLILEFETTFRILELAEVS
jgi:hypothetical protein